MAFIQSIPVRGYTRKILYTRYLSPVARTLRQVYSRVTSDSDVCEVDLDMQVSFLNTAL